MAPPGAIRLGLQISGSNLYKQRKRFTKKSMEPALAQSNKVIGSHNSLGSLNKSNTTNVFKKTRLKQLRQFYSISQSLEESTIRSIMTSCPDDEARDRRHGRAAVHVAMWQHRQHLSLRSTTSQPTRRHTTSKAHLTSRR